MKKKRKFPRPPKAKAIVAARERYDLTQEEAGALIYYSANGWQRLEYGKRALQPALWEFWLIRAQQEADKRAAASR